MTSDDEKRLKPPKRPRSGEINLFCANIMTTFHNRLVIASAIQYYVHKILRTVRGAENPTGRSAKSLVFGAILYGRSLIKRRKSRSPGTDPWGTPLMTGTPSDEL